MTETLTKQEFSLYSLLYLKFEKNEFDLNSIRWYFSKQMLKKLIFKLNEAGWIKTIKKGIYKCIVPENAIQGLFKQKTEEALEKAELKYCFSKASAAEIWSNQTYIQRSWEYSPFFVKVLKKDLKKWEKFLDSEGINFFIDKPANIVGEFIILKPVSSIKVFLHNKKPVESLKETIKFCEQNKDSFEYILAYFSKKYNKKTSASKEMLNKVREAI